jgi:hypothetical protein
VIRLSRENFINSAPVWNQKLEKYFYPIWKWLSRMATFETQFKGFSTELMAKIESAKEMEARLGPRPVWDYEEMEAIRTFHIHIESIINGNNGFQTRLNNFREEMGRKVKLVQMEKDCYQNNLPLPNSKIKDPDLSLDVIWNFYQITLQFSVEINNKLIQYLKLKISFLDMKIAFLKSLIGKRATMILEEKMSVDPPNLKRKYSSNEPPPVPTKRRKLNDREMN